MEEEIKVLLMAVSAVLEDNRFEKEDLMCHYIRIPALLTLKFSTNKNLANAVKFVQDVLSYYIYESELEYQFYAKALDYLNEVYDKPQKGDKDVLKKIDSQLDVMEELFMSRTMSTATVVEYFEELIRENLLTDKNYYISNVAGRIDEEEKMRLLNCIPEV